VCVCVCLQYLDALDFLYNQFSIYYYSILDLSLEIFIYSFISKDENVLRNIKKNALFLLYQARNARKALIKMTRKVHASPAAIIPLLRKYAK